jgi:hypothetical protein
MLTIYRRHTLDCGFTSRRKRSCTCPIWVQGKLHGKYLRQSLDIKNWDAAQAIVRDWESGGYFEVVPVEEALDKWIADARGRKAKEHTIAKMKQVRDRLLDYCNTKDLSLVSTITVAHMREFRESWPYAGATQEKKLERLKSFFKFCVESGWLKSSPAAPLKPPKQTQKPTCHFLKMRWIRFFRLATSIPSKAFMAKEIPSA